VRKMLIFLISLGPTQQQKPKEEQKGDDHEGDGQEHSGSSCSGIGAEDYGDGADQDNSPVVGIALPGRLHK